MQNADAPRGKSRIALAQWFGYILFALLIGAPVVGWLSQPNYERVAGDLRQRLLDVDTLAGFKSANKQLGLWCLDYEERDHTVVFCRKNLSFRIYSWVSWLDSLPKGVTARGEFVDGRNSGEYDVRIQ